MLEKVKSIDSGDLAQPELHGLLLAAVAPRPICFASTVDAEGRVNLSPFSFFNVFSSNPPVMIFSPARRGKDHTTKHTLDNVKEVPEVVINIVNHPMVEQMSLASTEYERGVNEFLKAGLTEVASEIVKPPRVAESPVSFECTVDDIIELGKGGGAGNLVISKVVRIHIHEKYLSDQGRVDSLQLDLVARMGGSWYSRCTPESMFEIPKPLVTKGIGVDALPGHVRNSDVLTGNDLGRLGNLEKLPTSDEIKQTLLTVQQDRESLSLLQIHHKAKDLLAEGKTEMALALLASHP